MLSDSERKALNEIERELIGDDPDITRGFTDAFEQPTERSSRPLWLYTVLTVLGVASSIVIVLLGSTVLLLVGFLVAVSAESARWVVWKRAMEATWT